MQTIKADIELLRGDDFYKTLQVQDEDENPVDITDYVFFLTVKESIDDVDDDALIRRIFTDHLNPTGGGAVISAPRTDLGGLWGSFYYDIQMQTAQGQVITIITGLLIVEKDVTQTTLQDGVFTDDDMPGFEVDQIDADDLTADQLSGAEAILTEYEFLENSLFYFRNEILQKEGTDYIESDDNHGVYQITPLDAADALEFRYVRVQNVGIYGVDQMDAADLTADQLAGVDPILTSDAFDLNSLYYFRNQILQKRGTNYTELVDRTGITLVTTVDADDELEFRYFKATGG